MSPVRPLGNRYPSLRTLLPATIAFGAVLLAAPAAWSQEPAADPIVRVEEDWVLILNSPNQNANSPQFHTLMSPFGDIDSYYAQVAWNYREIPEFLPGGLQLQAWNGETLIRTRAVGTTQLSTAAETIFWTQALQTNGMALYFSILNGHSLTWGEFGRDMMIHMDANLGDLSAYSTDVSVANACITYGSNRVNILAIVQVRYYSADGLAAVDSTPRIVYNLNQDLGG